jgi:hypothetical protein
LKFWSRRLRQAHDDSHDRIWVRRGICCRAGTLKCPEGANQFGKTVKVFPHTRQSQIQTKKEYCFPMLAASSPEHWPVVNAMWYLGSAPVVVG